MKVLIKFLSIHKAFHKLNIPLCLSHASRRNVKFCFYLIVEKECSSIFLLTAKRGFFIVQYEIAEVVELVDTLS